MLSLPRLTIRAILLLGLSLTLGMWLVSGYSFATTLVALQRQSSRVTRRHIRAQERMSAVRSQILLASVYARDALLDPNPESIVDYRAKLAEAFRINDEALAKYEPVLDTAVESEQVSQLRARSAEFQAAVLQVLQGDSSRWRDDALPLLREQIMPKREEAIAIADQVQSINRSAFIDQQAATVAIYRAAQRRTWIQFGIALAGVFIVGLVVMGQVSLLEHELRRRQERDARTNEELQRLSSQLILVQEEERRTIARELHDEIGQALTAIKVELSLAERHLDGPKPVTAALGAARGLAENTLQAVRDLSRLLHPVVLDDIGLQAAVEAYLREFRRRYELSVEYINEAGEVRMSRKCEVGAYRVIQEALTNVVRHAHASSCRVVTRQIGDVMEIVVEDNGVGFDVAASVHDPPSLGLIGMRERSVRLGGSCTVQSTPGRGTRVEVRLPLHVSEPVLQEWVQHV
jgi:signal transduction histidine kinase